MDSLRKWLYRPKRDDPSLLAQFYYADEELNMVASELDTFDGRKDPERCTALVNQLRHCQDKVVSLCMAIMDAIIPGERANRDFRAKFPDDVIQENLAGQLWFGAECLAAGSSILNRESESSRMRPLAKAVTKTIETVRNLLREQCLKSEQEYTEKIRESLKIFDLLFSEFELSYVSAMVPVKSAEEYEVLQCVVVLFSETVQRALLVELITQDQVDACDPALMFTIPRLAIVAGLLFFPDGPLNLDSSSRSLSHLFRPFKTLLSKIRELLWTMSAEELAALEKSLCSLEEPQHSTLSLPEDSSYSWPAPPTADGANPAGPGPDQHEAQTPLAFENAAFTSSFIQNFLARHPECRTLTAEDNLLPAPEKHSSSSGSSSRRVSSSGERKRDRGSQRSRGSSGSSAHRSASTRARLRQERLSDRFLAKLTGTEERPRVRRKSKKLPPSHGQEFGALPPAGNLRPSVTETLEVLPALLPPNTTVPLDSLSQLPSLEEAIRLQRAYDLQNERLQKAQLSATSVRRSNTLPASDLAAYINERRSIPSRPHVSEDSIVQPDSESDHDQSRPRPRRHHHSHASSNHRSSQSNDRPRQHRSKHSSGSRGRQRNENDLDTNGNFDPPNHASNWPHERTGGRNDMLTASTPRPQSFNRTTEGSIRSSNELLCDVEQNVYERGVSGVGYSQSSLVERNLPANDGGEFRVPVSIGECVSSAVAADPSIFGVHNLYHDMPVPDYQLSQPQEFSDRSPQYNAELVNAGERDSFDIGDEVLMSPSLENFNRRRPWHHQGGVHLIDSPRETIQSNLLSPTSEASESFSRYGSYYDNRPVATSEVNDEDHSPFANNFLSPPSVRNNSSNQQLNDISERMAATLALRHHEEEHEREIPCRPASLITENDVGAFSSTVPLDQSSPTAGTDNDGVSELLKANEEKMACEDRRGVPEDVGESSSSTCSDAGAAFSEDDELNDEEVALALQMAEVATAWRVRARFPDPRDLVQRLFVCISGVADQLQTNYASDLRRILRTVFLLNQTPDPPPHGKAEKDALRDADSHSTSQDSESLSVESAEDALAGIGSSSQPSSPSLSCNFPAPCPLSFSEHGLARCPPTDGGTALVAPEGEEQVSPAEEKQPNSPSNANDAADASGEESSTASLTSPVSEAATVPSSPTQLVPVPAVVCEGGRRGAEEPPCWVPDQEAPRCMACGASFTMLRRRHHCRNCGKVFCGGCSEHSVPLTHYGIWRPVRVCNICFLQYVTTASSAS